MTPTDSEVPQGKDGALAKCYRCKKPMEQPDLKEQIARERDWRQWLEDNPSEQLNEDERVLICMGCSEELEELRDD